MKILQFVGYKNSGKTTLVMNLIEFLTKEDFRVATLKHHGHGGVPLGFAETDSEKHRSAGAILSGVEGDGVLQLSSTSWSLEKMMSIYEMMDLDILLLEGFKKADFEKVILLRDEEDLELFITLNRVIAVVSPFQIKRKLPIPIFYFSEIDAFYGWVKQKFGEERASPID